jgi:hypothetical protein
MQKIVLSITLCLFSFLISAQSPEILDKLTENACDCVSKKDMSKIEPANMQLEMGMCIIGALDVLPKAERDKINITNNTQMQKLGESIGVRMANKCPKVLMEIARMSQAEEVKGSGASSPPPPANSGKIEGTVKEVTEGEFVTIVVTDNNQREQRLIWLGHFNGETDYIANPQLLKGKKVEINYYTQDRYVVKMHDYITYKQITELKVK